MASQIRLLTIAKIAPQKIGGFERWLIDISQRLTNEGHKHTICLEAEPSEAVRSALEGAGAQLTLASLDVSFTKQMKLTRHLLREHSPDVIHLHFYAQIIGPISLQLWLSRKPLLVTYHISGAPAEAGFIKRTLKRIRYQLLGRSIERIVCVSKFSQSKLLADYQVPVELSEVIYNGVTPLPHAPRHMEAERPTLSVAAHLIPEKGVQFAIEALDVVKERFPEVSLLIAGEGTYRSTLEEHVATLGLSHRVTFLGLRSDVPEIFASSHIVIVPSIWAEAFGYTVIEGMAAGRPLVASKIGGIPEIIEDGVSGLLLSPATAQH
jgi:glycosyltransferase involved in cell wall biosynthesis